MSSKPKTVRRSAGLLMYRQTAGGTEFFLVHPGGPYFARKDEGAWGIPKGGIEAGEQPLAAACREFNEETAMVSAPPYIPLGEIRMRDGKFVVAWAFAWTRPENPPAIVCNTFPLEWPPRSGKIQHFPECDRGEFYSEEQAYIKVTQAQRPFLDRLRKALSPE